MMDYQSQLKLQSYLDGELSESEAREVAALLAKDSEAVGLLAELRNTRKALVGHEATVRVPDTREFYWSQIRRQIEAQQPVATPRPRESLIASWRRFLMPAGAVAAAIIAGLLLLSQLTPGSPEAETATADSGAFTYRDYDSGTTLVWMSYPAENELVQAEPASIVQ